MDLDIFKPTFLIQIEGQELSLDITQEITSFIFEDNEEELDVMELVVANRELRFTDDSLFQEGNEVAAQLGMWGICRRINAGGLRKASVVIKEIDYDFPEDGVSRFGSRHTTKDTSFQGKKTRRFGRSLRQEFYIQE